MSKDASPIRSPVECEMPIARVGPLTFDVNGEILISLSGSRFCVTMLNVILTFLRFHSSFFTGSCVLRICSS